MSWLAFLLPRYGRYFYNTTMALTFAKTFGIKLNNTEEWFDPCIWLDSPLFIDPFLMLDLELIRK